MQILNLTQHNATAEQQAVGVVEPADKAQVQALLTFATLPTPSDMHARANALTELAKAQGAKQVMVGGAGYFMPYLERALIIANIKPLHAFTVREVVETVQADGTVEKVAKFRHAGFIQAQDYIYEECYQD